MTKNKSKTIINLFGSTTPAGEFIEYLLKKKFPTDTINTYSRVNKKHQYLDFNNHNNIFPEDLNKDAIWISFAPIWEFSAFLDFLSNSNIEILSHIKGLIVCSSSSIITKRFAFNSFDKKLVQKLKISENKILELSNIYKISTYILRPTMIYGDSKNYKDKNINQIINIMRISPFIIFPNNSGYRQPIHSFELAEVTLYLLNKLRIFSNFESKIISLGGDQELQYYKLLKLIKNNSCEKGEKINCKILLINSSIFYLLLSPLILVSPKTYESLLRINANLSGFTPSSELLKKEISVFPFRPQN